MTLAVIFPGFDQGCSVRVAQGLPFASFDAVLSARANAHIADLVCPGVSVSRHAVLIRSKPSFIPFATSLPNVPPLLERKPERNTATLRSVFMPLIRAMSGWQVGSPSGRVLSQLIRVGGAPFASPGILLGAMRLMPSALVGAQLLSAIVGISHWLLSPRTVVRGGTGASTPMPSRLYHTLPAEHI